jgi:signal peptidase II
MFHKRAIYAPLVIFWVVVDFITKRAAVAHLVPEHVPHNIVSDVLRFTLLYNPGAAFSMYLGPSSRWIFAAFTCVALVVLWTMYRQADPRDWLRTVSVALITGGALGNLIDRIMSSRGVVDFIDIGIGSVRFWTFNVADMGVSVGAVLLLISLYQESRKKSGATSSAAS